MADYIYTPIDAPVTSITTPTNTVNPIPTDPASTTPIYQQINEINSNLASQVLALVNQLLQNAQTSINEANTSNTTNLNNVATEIYALLGSDAGSLSQKITEINAIFEKYGLSDVNILAGLDAIADRLNLGTKRDYLANAVSVTSLTADGDKGFYHEITLPAVTLGGVSITSLDQIDLKTLDVKINRRTNKQVDVVEIDTSDSSRIRIYFESKGLHFEPQAYDMTASWAKPFTFDLAFERKMIASEQINFTVTTSDSTGNTVTSGVGLANN